MPRICRVESAFLRSGDTDQDGAYDLFDLVGTPDRIGEAIAATLKTADLFGGREMRGVVESGGEVKLAVVIVLGDAACP